jgi:hypothetical protein
MIINEKELELDIREMLEIYNNDIEFTEKELDELVIELYQEVEEAMYQASSDVVINYSNKYLNK